MIRRLLAFILAAGIAGCAQPPPTAPADGAAAGCVADRGIGGTGQRVATASDRGIGGTGISGTGVIGVITGFGSICVNGLKVTYPPDIAVETPAGPAGIADLRVGQIVAVLTDGTAAIPTARRLALLEVVRGPAEALGDNEVLIAGQRIRPTAGFADTDLLRVGQWVVVSGLRRGDGTIAASRIDPAPPGDASITGLVELHNRAPAIGTTRLTGAKVRLGEVTTVTGHYEAGVLRVSGARAETLRPFGAAVGHVVVEAFVAVEGDRLRLGQGAAVRRAPNLPAPPVDAAAVVDIVEDAGGELIAIDLHVAPGLDGIKATTTTATTTTKTTATTTSTTKSSTSSSTSGTSSTSHGSSSTSSSGSSSSASSGSGATAAGHGGSTGSTGSSGAKDSGSSGTGSGGTGSGGTASGGGTSSSGGSSGTGSGGSGSTGTGSGGTGSGGSSGTGKDSGSGSGSKKD